MSYKYSKPVAFRQTPLAVAVALTLGAPAAAMAGTPTANQLPGGGHVTSNSPTQSIGPQKSGSAPGTETIKLNGNTIIKWGGSGSGATVNSGKTPVGFNIGSSATLHFVKSSGVSSNIAVLNQDVTGNKSYIKGTLNDIKSGGVHSNVGIYVANPNGIIVGPNAAISSGRSVGLISNNSSGGSTLNSTSFGAGSGPYDSITFQGSQSSSGGTVTVNSGASISSSTVLVAGNSNVNVGNLGAIAGSAGSKATTVLAGEPSGNFATGMATSSNANASMTVSGTAPANTTIRSAGTLQTGATKSSMTNFAANAGTLTLQVGQKQYRNSTYTGQQNGTLTNKGTLVLQNPSSSKLNVPFNVVNNGNVRLTLNGGQDAVFHNNVTNHGQFQINAVTNNSSLMVTGGDLKNLGTGNRTSNNQTIDATGGNPLPIQVTNGSITNHGVMKNIAALTTGSDSTLASFTPGASYSITNTGQISGLKNYLQYTLPNGTTNQYVNGIDVNYANRTGADNNSTGSFTNNGGTLSVASGSGLAIHAQNNLTLGGTVQVNGTSTASSPLSFVDLVANQGNVTDGTSLTFTPNNQQGEADYAGFIYKSINGGAAVLKGQQVTVNNNLSGVINQNVTTPAGSVTIAAGPMQSSGNYAIKVGSGATVSANDIDVWGQTATDHPNVLLNGTLAGNNIQLGGVGNSVVYGGSTRGPVSDVFSNPSYNSSSNVSGYVLNGVSQTQKSAGSVATTTNPTVTMNFTRKVKVQKTSNQSSNFRFRYLPINSDGTLNLKLHPLDYRTNGTTNYQNGVQSAVNILVNNNVNVHSISKPNGVPGPTGGSTAGVTSFPDTHFVLQSTGNIDLKTPHNNANGVFYWPGYTYLGTIQKTMSGKPAPGTLSSYHEVRAQSNVNNVLPGSKVEGSGMHLVTQHLSLTNGAQVVTNFNDTDNSTEDTGTKKNYQIYLPTSALASHYGSINANQKIFYGGTLNSSGNVVYNSLVNTSKFHYQALNSTR